LDAYDRLFLQESLLDILLDSVSVEEAVRNTRIITDYIRTLHLTAQRAKQLEISERLESATRMAERILEPSEQQEAVVARISGVHAAVARMEMVVMVASAKSAEMTVRYDRAAAVWRSGRDGRRGVESRRPLFGEVSVRAQLVADESEESEGLESGNDYECRF